MTNSNVKVTRSQALAMAIEGQPLSAEAIEVLKKIKASVEKKSASSGKPTKAQIENARLTDILAEVLVGAEPMTVSAIIKYVPEFNDFNTQKVTPMLKDSRFKKDVVGKNTLYSLA